MDVNDVRIFMYGEMSRHISRRSNLDSKGSRMMPFISRDEQWRALFDRREDSFACLGSGSLPTIV